MERLKAELLMIGKDRGDIGTTENHRTWINHYIEALQRFLTPEGIKSFTAEQLRDPYVEYIKAVISNCSREQSADLVILFFHTRRIQRDKVLELPVSSDSVVDIFSRRS